MQDDPTLRLARALADQRSIHHQAIILSGLLAGCAMWRFSPLHEPEPLVGIAIIVGVLALAVLLLLGWVKHEVATESTDDVILTGSLPWIGHTPVQRAVRHRIDSIETTRARRRLAADLRWRIRLAEGAVRPSPGYIRASVLPPLCSFERHVLLDERSLVTALAERIEAAPADPRALIILWRLITTPPRLDAERDVSAGEELARRLHAAHALICTPGNQTDTV